MFRYLVMTIRRVDNQKRRKFDVLTFTRDNSVLENSNKSMTPHRANHLTS